MTESEILILHRLGVAVYLRSPRTGRVWEIKSCLATITPGCRLRGFPVTSVSPNKTGHLTKGQVEWHLKYKPENFTLEPPHDH